MNLTFSDLKRNRSLTSTDLLKKAQETTTKNFDDDRFWQCQTDKAGNGYAVIRFLTVPKGEDFAWIKYYRHSFKGPTGKWYIENSLTSLDLPDPVNV